MTPTTFKVVLEALGVLAGAYVLVTLLFYVAAFATAWWVLRKIK